MCLLGNGSLAQWQSLYGVASKQLASVIARPVTADFPKCTLHCTLRQVRHMDDGARSWAKNRGWHGWLTEYKWYRIIVSTKW